MAAPSRQALLHRLRLLRDCAAKGMTAEDAAKAVGIVPGTLKRTLTAIQPGATWPLADDVMAQAVARQEEWIASVAAPGGAWQPSPRQRNVVALAEQVFDLMPGVILSGSRARLVVRARQAAVVVLLRCWPGMSTNQAGVVLDMDHSSVVTARQRAEETEVSEPYYGTQIWELRQLVEAQAMPKVPPAPPLARDAVREFLRTGVIRQQAEFEADGQRKLLAGMLGTRGGKGMGRESLPQDAVLSAEALRDGSAALLAAICREHPERCAA